MEDNKASQDVLEEARKLYKRAKDAWDENYRAAEEDLYFLSDVPGAQWDQKAYNDRIKKGRPALQLDQLDKFCNQVINDERMSTPTINIIPDGNGAAKEDAEIIQGIVRNIEYQSEADTAYDTGAECAVKCGIGWIEVDHEYEDEGFEQRLVIKRVPNPLSILIDPDSIQLDGSDAMYGFKLEQITAKKFKELYPDLAPVSFSENQEVKPVVEDEDVITIAEFLRVEESDQEIGLLLGGGTEPAREGGAYIQTRKIKKRIVRRYKLSGQDVLEPTTFPGKYIRFIPVYGKEMWREGKRYLHSLIRKAKGPQQLANMMSSLEIELLMRQPRANFIAPAQAVQNYANDWKAPEDAAVLMYDHVGEDSQPVPPPIRVEPPIFPQGIEMARQSAIQAIKDATGIYDASLGMRSNETSGIAIQRRQQEGDVATFHFSDNRVKSITQVGRVLLFAIPEIYDTPRVLQMIDSEDNAKPIGVNGAVTEGQERRIDLNRGKYTVKVTTGASFTTRRQEAAQLMGDAIKALPQLMNVMGDLYFENMDMPGAQEIANRLKKTMPPQLVEGDDQDPVVINLQGQLQQAQQALQALQAQLAAADKTAQQKDAELLLKSKEIDNDKKIESADLMLKEQQMQLDAQNKQLELQEKQLELQAKQIELKIKEIEAAAKLQSLNMQRENQQMEAMHAQHQQGEMTA